MKGGEWRRLKVKREIMIKEKGVKIVNLFLSLLRTAYQDFTRLCPEGSIRRGYFLRIIIKTVGW